MGQKDNKKGDMLDGMLFFGKENSDPIQFSDYPETVVGTLRLFYNTWKIPSYVIPSKKSKSKFEEWINQLTDLNGICPNLQKMTRAMQIAKEDFEKFTDGLSEAINHIKSISPVFEAVAEQEEPVLEGSKNNFSDVSFEDLDQ